MTHAFPMYLAGYWKENGNRVSVTNPYDDSEVGATFLATPADLDHAIKAALDAAPKLKATPTWQRAAWLQELADRLESQRDTIISTLAREAGKPVNDATTEFNRGIFTIRYAAEETNRIGGEVIPLDLMQTSAGRTGIVRRFPIGPVAGITPFNFPLNLPMHKLAPAIASGSPIVLKPATKTPLTMLLVAHELDKLGMPKGAVSVLPMDRETGDAMVEDDRFKLLSFTGSPAVGWRMKERAGKKKVTLELGGNAGAYIDNDADLDFAVSRIRTGGFAYAGQACISVQRVFIHQERYDEARSKIVEAIASLKTGDPMDASTELGPMISVKEAERVESWLHEARAAGAKVLTGGERNGAFMQPTVLENAPRHSKVCAQEAFAPVITLTPVESFASGINQLNDTTFGLQAGIFTNNLEHALAAFDEIDAGGVIINDVPSFRIDHMPYGGVKDSGLGREGIRWAIEDMTEPKLMVLNRLASQKVEFRSSETIKE
jgi:acyl-CoA reductase-like NAD-dependent aldehyde dehydrogenase